MTEGPSYVGSTKYEISVLRNVPIHCKASCPFERSLLVARTYLKRGRMNTLEYNGFLDSM